MAIQISRIAISLIALSLVGCASTGSRSTSDAAAIKAGLAAASAAKVAVVESFAVTGAWADSNATAGYEAAAVTGPAAVSVGAGGVITILYPQLDGHVLVLKPFLGRHGQVHWSCASHGLASEAAPEGCR